MLLEVTQAGICEAGCDEAGRGCLAGPVIAAAVVLPEGFGHPTLNDSKQLSAKQRDHMRELIEREALAWAIGKADVAEIDRINILQASIMAMHRALAQLNLPLDSIAVDGNRFKPFKAIPHHTIVGGDGLYLHIAAASVLAKTHRDEIMRQLHRQYPEYAWDQNKGYPTIAHRDALREYGTTPQHRRSFRLLSSDQPALF